MLKLLSSIKLTLFLLLLLALISVGGTIAPVESQRYELYYQSLWFRCLLSLLAVNLICCTGQTLSRKWHERRRLIDSLATRQDGELLSLDLRQLESRLVQSGYRVTVADERLLAQRGAVGRWGSTLVHIAVLVIMVGGLLGETGFVGTINTYLLHVNERYFDWDEQQEKELGFQLRADAFRLRYYPIQLRFELLDSETGRKLDRLMLYDNQSFKVPDSLLTGRLRGFDPDARVLTVDVYRGDALLGQYRVGDRFDKFGDGQPPPFRLSQVEFRDPVLKQMESEVSILEAGQVVKQGPIRVNQPLVYRGISIFQTAYGQDDLGTRTVGFQLSKDPGEMFVWGGTLLLLLGLVLAFFLPRSALGAKTVAGQVLLLPLHGWRGLKGDERWQQLLQHLAE